MRAVASFEIFRPGDLPEPCAGSSRSMATAILGRKFVNNCPSPTVRHLHLANFTLAYYYNNDNTIFFQFFFHIPFALRLSGRVSIFIIFLLSSCAAFYLFMGHDCWRGAAGVTNI